MTKVSDSMIRAFYHDQQYRISILNMGLCLLSGKTIPNGKYMGLYCAFLYVCALWNAITTKQKQKKCKGWYHVFFIFGLCLFVCFSLSFVALFFPCSLFFLCCSNKFLCFSTFYVFMFYSIFPKLNIMWKEFFMVFGW